jgi:hypothetical protein
MKLCFDGLPVRCLTTCFTVRESSIHLMHCGPALELMIEILAQKGLLARCPAGRECGSA